MLTFSTLLAQTVDAVDTVNETAAPVTEAAPSSDSLWLVLLIVAAMLIVPFLLGEFVARALKMKERALRFGVIFFALTLGLSPFVRLAMDGKGVSDAFKLGIDLAGGMNIVFQVDRTQAAAEDKDVSTERLNNMVGAIKRRIDPANTKEIVVRTVGGDQIEVIVPDVDAAGAEAVVDVVTQLGELEFAVLATDRRSDHEEIIQRARNLDDDQDEVRFAGRLQAAWRPVARDADGNQKTTSLIDGNGRARNGVQFRQATRLVTKRDGTTNEEEVLQFLAIYDKEDRRVKGENLQRVYPTTDPTSSGPAVGFVFNSEGANDMARLTSAHRPDQARNFQYHLAIILDGQLESAPTINSTISTSGQITGQFSPEERDSLINILNAGALQLPLRTGNDEIEKHVVDPLLGEEVRQKGTTAITVSAIVVLVFMVGYYFLAGAVADLCLIFNIVLVLGTMAFIQAAFTLPGLAGIVLTIGMAVDANVLIFERIREEQSRGSSLKMAIQNGFDRAFTTIVDANLTTLITAVVLYMIGTDQIKGFAVTLFIGIVMSMFTALYVGRLVFEVLERKKIITSLAMAPAIGRGLDLDFIGKRKLAAVLSLIVIVGGMAAFVSRGKDNFDIDLVGGSMVSFEFEKPQELEPVQAALAGAFEDPVSVERLRTLDDQDADKVRQFRLRSRNPDQEVVATKVQEAFGDKEGMGLTYLVMQPGDVEDAKNEDGETIREVDIEFFQKRGDELDAREFPASVVRKELIAELIDIKVNKDGKEESKYGRAGEIEPLIDIEGTSGSGIDDPTKPAPTFEKFTLTVDSKIASDDLSSALAAISERYEERPWFRENTTFGTAFAEEMRFDGIMALLISLLAIIGYLWFRFQRVTFGFAAVVALVHDILITFGMLAIGAYLSQTPVGPALGLIDFKIDLPMIAAFLTIVGYSLNDTIVVFDRIREVRGKNPALTGDMINKSLNQTLNRTLMTSITTLIVVGILYIWGGEGIHGFAYCLVLGVLVGTYSSIFVASPVLLWLMNRPGAQPVRSTRPTQASPTT